MNLVLDPEAQAELSQAAIHYELEREGLGFTFTQRIDETLANISTNPHLYPAIRKKLRKATVTQFPYVIYYRVEIDRIRVVAIFHGHRNPRSVWRRV